MTARLVQEWRRVLAVGESGVLLEAAEGPAPDASTVQCVHGSAMPRKRKQNGDAEPGPEARATGQGHGGRGRGKAWTPTKPGQLNANAPEWSRGRRSVPKALETP